MPNAYPLEWPAGWERTKVRTTSRFKLTFSRARDFLFAELDRLGARNVVLSTNNELKANGEPRHDRRPPEDPGVAVYFQRNGKEQCIPCDRWDTVCDNMQAIAKTIDALRGIERWGSGKMVNAAFHGFKALPASENQLQWWQVLNVQSHTPTEEVTASYRRLAMLNHPDRGGSTEAMTRINSAYDHFKQVRGVA